MSVNDWKEVKLGKVCNILSGYAFKSNEFCEKGVPVVKIKNIIPPYVDISDTNYVSEYLAYEKKKYLLGYNDVLISMTGSNVNQFSSAVGKVARVKIRKPMLLNQRVGKFEIVDNNLYNLDFLYYLISTDEMHYKLASNASGAANQANISPKMIKDILLPNPPLQEQKTIAATLSCLDDKIELNNRMNQTLEEMAQAIFKSWFVDFEPFQDGEFVDSELGRIPKGWRVSILGDFASFIKGKKPRIFNSEFEEEFLFPYLTINVLNDGEPQYANTDKMVLAEKLDILMVMDGASSGSVYFGKKGIVASTLAKFSLNDFSMREIVYQYLKYNEKEIKQHTTGSAIPHVDKAYVLNSKILLPDLKSKALLQDLFTNIRIMILENKQQNQKLKQLGNTLLPKLMSGEVRVPIPEVE